MLNDPEPTIRKLLDLIDLPVPSSRGTRLRIRMDDVVSIDAPSLLLFCAQLRWLNDYRQCRNSGTYPTHKKALAALRDGGFRAFIEGRLPAGDLGPRTLAMILGTKYTDTRVRPEVPARLQRFLIERNPRHTDEEVNAIYNALMECLENVRQHAYPKVAGERRPSHFAKRSWYVVGLYDEDEKKTTLAILDEGIGVVKSASRSIGAPDKIRDFLMRNPADILELASSGMRTETGEAKRGRGLKSLRDFAQSEPGRRFHLISSGAMVTWASTGVTKRNTSAFGGTIVCLELGS